MSANTSNPPTSLMDIETANPTRKSIAKKKAFVFIPDASASFR